MNEHRATKKALTAGLIILGVCLMGIAPLFGSVFLSGILFFGGAAIALTALVAKIKHGFMDGAFTEATREHDIFGALPAAEPGVDPVSDVAARGLDGAPSRADLELTATDIKFLGQAKIGE